MKNYCLIKSLIILVIVSSSSFATGTKDYYKAQCVENNGLQSIACTPANNEMAGWAGTNLGAHQRSTVKCGVSPLTGLKCKVKVASSSNPE